MKNWHHLKDYPKDRLIKLVIHGEEQQANWEKAYNALKAEREADRKDAQRYRSGDILVSYSRADGAREWASVGAWLHRGQCIMVVEEDHPIDSAISAKEKL